MVGTESEATAAAPLINGNNSEAPTTNGHSAPPTDTAEKLNSTDAAPAPPSPTEKPYPEQFFANNGFQPDHAYRIAVKFYKAHSDEAARLTYDTRNRLAALSKQVCHSQPKLSKECCG